VTLHVVFGRKETVGLLRMIPRKRVCLEILARSFIMLSDLVNKRRGSDDKDTDR
jgi:hypothetical protein